MIRVLRLILKLFGPALVNVINLQVKWVSKYGLFCRTKYDIMFNKKMIVMLLSLKNHSIVQELLHNFSLHYRKIFSCQKTFKIHLTFLHAAEYHTECIFLKILGLKENETSNLIKGPWICSVSRRIPKISLNRNWVLTNVKKLLKNNWKGKDFDSRWQNCLYVRFSGTYISRRIIRYSGTSLKRTPL